MYMPHKEHGFTLIEVLVALAIIAIALAAAARVSGVMTHSNGLLRDRATGRCCARRTSLPSCAWRSTWLQADARQPEGVPTRCSGPAAGTPRHPARRAGGQQTMSVQRRIRLGSSGPSANGLTLKRFCSEPCSITTPSASIATRRTSLARCSPTMKLPAGPSLRLMIATAPRAPAMSPDTLICTGEGWSANQWRAGLALAGACPTGALPDAGSGAISRGAQNAHTRQRHYQTRHQQQPRGRKCKRNYHD